MQGWWNEIYKRGFEALCEILAVSETSALPFRHQCGVHMQTSYSYPQSVIREEDSAKWNVPEEAAVASRERRHACARSPHMLAIAEVATPACICKLAPAEATAACICKLASAGIVPSGCCGFSAPGAADVEGGGTGTAFTPSGAFRSTTTTVTLSLLPRSMAALVRTLAAMRTADFDEAPFSRARCRQRSARFAASCGWPLTQHFLIIDV